MTQISIRVDDVIKKDADALFADLGMNMTTAINVFLHQAVRKRAIPFDIEAKSEDPFYSEENMRVLRQSISDLEARKNLVTKSMDELLEMEK